MNFDYNVWYVLGKSYIEKCDSTVITVGNFQEKGCQFTKVWIKGKDNIELYSIVELSFGIGFDGKPYIKNVKAI